MTRVVTMLVVALVWAQVALAALPTGLQDDFAPIDGMVLAVRKGAVLIDAAADKGVRVGELFSVLQTEEPLKHPVSGELIPGLDTLTGVLVVTEVRPEFSVARQLSGSVPKAGATVRRYDRVKAWFIDPAGQGEAVFAEVRAGLPQLDWQPYAKATAVADDDVLTFELQGNRLEARGAGELLHSYTVELPAPVAAAPVPVPTPIIVLDKTPAAAPAVTAAPQGAQPVVPQAAKAVEQRQPSKWLGASVKKVPLALAVADFDGDGRQEIARAFTDGVEIGRLVDGKYGQVAELELKRGRDGLSLAAFDLNDNGKPELYFTAVSGDSVLTAVYEFADGDYRKLADDQRWFVSVVPLADGPALLGQRRELGLNPFSATVSRLKWQQEELAEAGQVRVPGSATIYSLASFKPAGDDRFVRVDDAGRLALSGYDETALWTSAQSGGTEIGFEQAEVQTSGTDELKRSVFLPGPLYVGKDGLVVAAFNGGFTGSSVFRQMTTAEVVGWRWEGFELMPKWEMKDIEGYIPALTIADADNDGTDELVMLLAYPNMNPFGSRRSVIRLLALN